ncbi:MAG TPA: hypothetical protein DET40_03140 [Lentisphaeria bacterium]|nr:MAG: hypothetical protein A2X45_22350 [Lentisphaerae bacterium GWF2_50_93]HCE42526.1 hypothetical protein [Lentisphaeria bacterium]
MREVLFDVDQVAYCGLYCGACAKYLNEKCNGCHTNEKATWCKVRSCCIEKKLASCAGCDEFKDPRQCSKFNNIFSKLFGLVFGSDRPACIECIRDIGSEAYARKMAALKLHAIKR